MYGDGSWNSALRADFSNPQPFPALRRPVDGTPHKYLQEGNAMNRRQRTIRGVDDDAWEMLGEVAALNRTARGALVTDAIRFWYAHLDVDDTPAMRMCSQPA